MADVVEQGPGGRGGLLVGVVAVALLVAGGAFTLLRDDGRPVAGATPSLSPSPSPSAEELPEAPPPEPVEPEPVRVDGVPLRERTGLTVVLAASNLVRYDVDRRSVGPVEHDGDPAGTPNVIRVSGGVFASWPEVGDFPPPEAPVWAIADGGRPAHAGVASQLLASRTPGAVWFVRHGMEDVELTLRGLDGRVRRRVQVATDAQLVGETDSGLVLNFEQGPMLLDRRDRTRRLQAARPQLTTARATLGYVECGYGCWRLDRLDVATGRRQSVTLPAGRAPHYLVASPDGRTVALLLATAPEPPNATNAQLYLLDLGTMQLRRQRGVVLPVEAALSWSADGRWLVVAAATGAGTTLAVWRPGMSRLGIVRTDLPPVTSIAAY